MIAFLEKYGRLVFISLSVIVLVIVVFVIVAETQERNKDRALVQLDEIESEIQDSDSPLSIEAFSTRAEEIASISNDAYVQNRIHFLAGQVYWEQKRYTEAAERYLQLAQETPRSHLGQVSFFNAAAAYEQSGDIARAVEIFEQALSEYEFTTNPLLPRILLNLGRLYEMRSNTARASEYYNTLIENYSGNELINLAYDRLILIESDG